MAAPKKKPTPARKPRPRILGTLEKDDLFQLNQLYDMVVRKDIELTALRNHYLKATDEVQKKYNLPPKFQINFGTGKITEAEE